MTEIAEYFILNIGGTFMREIKLDEWERNKTFKWFKSFSNSTYSMNVKMDVTTLLKHTKEHKESFFINLLYIVVNGLN